MAQRSGQHQRSLAAVSPLSYDGSSSATAPVACEGEAWRHGVAAVPNRSLGAVPGRRVSVVLCARPQTGWPRVYELYRRAHSSPRRPGGSEVAAESLCAPAGPCCAGGYRGARATAALVAAAAAAADIAEAAAPSEPSPARRGRHCRPGGGARGGAAGLTAPCHPRRRVPAATHARPLGGDSGARPHSFLVAAC